MNDNLSQEKLEEFTIPYLEMLVDAPSLVKKVTTANMWLIMKWIYFYFRSKGMDDVKLRFEKGKITNFSGSSRIDVINLISMTSRNVHYDYIVMLKDNRIALINEGINDYHVEVFQLFNIDKKFYKLRFIETVQEIITEFITTTFESEMSCFEIEIPILK
ncbi:MAG: hypothetical protein EOM50_06200 [Erysipelotrichia bacterium]|nr:hypothetical protein [Erysipelotrichia bacterium]NCC54871.1 hypothetical protein [Erysipelotrichia bacterium]